MQMPSPRAHHCISRAEIKMSSETETHPFFVYGTLKPGQVAHHQIENEIDSARTVQAKAKSYYLAIRDGLPYAYSLVSGRKPNNAEIEHLKGFLIYPKLGHEKSLSEKIDAYEDQNLYLLKENEEITTLSGEIVQASIYVTKKAQKRLLVERDDGDWRITDDPILGRGFPRLVQLIHDLDLENMKMVPADKPEDDYWGKMWMIQGAFANLTSVWEHFSRFYFGAGLNKSEYVTKTDKLVKSDSLLAQVKVPYVEVHNAKTAKDPLKVNTKSDPFRTWYQVRNNMVHSGKDGQEDLKILRNSIIGMVKLLQAVILLVIPDLKIGHK